MATDYKHSSHSVYSLSKSGVVYLTDALALKLALEVQIFAVVLEQIADNEDMTILLVNQVNVETPLKRLISREEIAEVVFQLHESPFSMAMGQTIALDEGRSIPRIAYGTTTG